MRPANAQGDCAKKKGGPIMKTVSKPLAALVLGLAITATATPSFAQRVEGMSGARAQALRGCNAERAVQVRINLLSPADSPNNLKCISRNSI
jgi:hypothetical protein